MKDSIINFGKGVLLDGVKLGTASVVGDLLGRATRKVLGLKKNSDDERDDSDETKKSRASGLRDLISTDD